MQKLIVPFLFAIALINAQTTFSQCADGETSVQFIVTTDNWGYETYYEVVSSGQTCGEGEVLIAGGNMDVGCDGTGTGASEAETMANNTYYITDEICVADSSQIDIIHVDSYGDGGADFYLLLDGVESGYYEGTGVGNVFTIDVGSPNMIPHDVPCDALEIATDGMPVLISSSEATVSYFETSPPALGCNVPGGWCEGAISNTVWAKFTVAADTRYRIATCNDDTNFDTQLALYVVGTCGDFDSYELIGSNDDGGCGVGNGYASITYSPCLPEGTEVYIQIDGWYGATGIAELTVSEYSSTPTLVSDVDNISCALEDEFNPDGSISVYFYEDGLGSIATWTGPFGYTGEGNYINGLLPGVYNLSLESSCPNDPTHTASFEIINPEPLDLDLELVSSCENGSGGSLYLEITGGTGDYDVLWTGPEGMESEEQDQIGVESGDYAVIVTDDQGCSSSLEVEVPYVGITPFSLGADMEMCAGDMNFFFAPSGNYMYEWQDGSTNSVYILQTEEGVPTTAVVGLSVVNEYGCELSDAVVVTVVNCAGVEENGPSSWGLSPNPASTSMQLNLSGVTPGSRVVVRDYQGRVVMNQSASPTIQWDVTTVGSGFYLVEVINESGVVVWQSKAIVE